MSYIVVDFEDHQGNVDTEGKISNGIAAFLYENHFKCSGGFWGCPWYFVDIENKTFIPGRLGVSFGDVTERMTFEKFKRILKVNE